MIAGGVKEKKNAQTVVFLIFLYATLLNQFLIHGIFMYCTALSSEVHCRNLAVHDFHLMIQYDLVRKIYKLRRQSHGS